MLRKIKDVTLEELGDDILRILNETPERKISLGALALMLKMSDWCELNDVDFLSAIMRLMTGKKIKAVSYNFSATTTPVVFKLIEGVKSQLEKRRVESTFFVKPGHGVFINESMATIRIGLI